MGYQKKSNTWFFIYNHGYQKTKYLIIIQKTWFWIFIYLLKISKYLPKLLGSLPVLSWNLAVLSSFLNTKKLMVLWAWFFFSNTQTQRFIDSETFSNTMNWWWGLFDSEHFSNTQNRRFFDPELFQIPWAKDFVLWFWVFFSNTQNQWVFLISNTRPPHW